MVFGMLSVMLCLYVALYAVLLPCEVLEAVLCPGTVMAEAERQLEGAVLFVLCRGAVGRVTLCRARAEGAVLCVGGAGWAVFRV